jgi:AcrR family transcriptional regulator
VVLQAADPALTFDRSINNLAAMAVKGTRAPRTRSSSDERREQVIAAAVKEFAANGFHATSTSSIAKRAGISQPYIYALFPNKRELFLAVDRHVVDRIRQAFLEVARGHTTPEERLEAMGHAYIELLANRDEIRFQMQAHAAAGNPDLAEPIRREFMRLWADVRRMSGASDEQVMEFIAKGMLLNVAASLELPAEFLPGEQESLPSS